MIRILFPEKTMTLCPTSLIALFFLKNHHSMLDIAKQLCYVLYRKQIKGWDEKIWK
jgi:hypothetical protein